VAEKGFSSCFWGVGLALFLVFPSVYALPQDVVVSTPEGQALTIELTPMLEGMVADRVDPAPAVTVGGSASVQLTTAAGLIVTARVSYTPNAGFVGIDSFDYVVFNGAAEVGRATISVTVGDVISEGQSPETEISDTLIDICLQNRTGQLIDLCDAFSTATQSGAPAELKDLLDALAPKDAAAQMTMANSIAAQQASNIVKRLNALRQGVRGFSLGGLAFYEGGRSISGSQLLGSQETGIAQGGAASGDAAGSSLGVFLSGYIQGGNQEVSPNEDAFEFSSQSLTGGFDYRFGSSGVLGLSGGVSSSEMNLADNAGGLDLLAYTASIYGSWYPAAGMYVDLVYGHNAQNFDIERRIVFPGTDTSAYAETDSVLKSLSIGAGYELNLGGGHALNLSGRYDSVSAVVDAYDELGSSAFNLSMDRRELQRRTSTIGAQYTVPISLQGAVLIPAVDVSWVHQFFDEADSISGTFQADPNQTKFQFFSSLPDQDYFKLALGFSMIVPGGSTGFLQVDSTLGREYYSDYGVSAGYRMEF